MTFVIGGHGDRVDGMAAARGHSLTIARAETATPSRLTRSGVFAGVSLALAVTAHVLAGGAFPSPTALAGAGCALLVFALTVTGRERHGGFIAASVITTQLLLHAVFALLPVASVLTASSGIGSAGGSDQTAFWARLLFCHHGPHPITTSQVTAAKATLGISGSQLPSSGVSHGATTGTGSVLVAAASSWPVLGMLAAHLAAAAIMAWWLRRGERAVWAASRRVVQAVLSRLVSWPQFVPVAPPQYSRPIHGRDGAWHERIRDCVCSERGPPVAARA